MGRMAGQQAQKSGLPPGSLVHIGEQRTATPRITVTKYDAQCCETHEVKEFAECELHLPTDGSVTWVNVDGIHEPGAIETLGRLFDLHPLLLEDVMNAGQRPKMEEYDDCVFIVLKMIYNDEKTEKIVVEQVSFVLGKRFVLSFQEREGDVFDGVRERLRVGKGRLRRSGADYLAYALIDSIVDNYFIVLEEMGDLVEELETEITTMPRKGTIQELHLLKREALFLRKAVWPARDVIGSLGRLEGGLVAEATAPYLRDAYDHVVQVAETIEVIRDVLSSLLDVYLSSLSNKANEIMKVLAIISTIFIPLTFVAGLYGMNFKYMPELEQPWGYPVVLVLMFGMALSMIVYFKRQRWW